MHLDGRFGRFALATFAIGLVLLGSPAGTASAPGALHHAGLDGIARAGAATPPMRLAVTPTSVRVGTGASALLTATWTDVPTDCRLGPVGYRWASGTGGLYGSLFAGSNRTARFVADGAGAGASLVVVRSLADFDCAGVELLENGSARTRVQVVAPLTLSGIGVAPDPIPAGGSVDLNGTVEGGSAPYSVRVDWNDGSYSNLSVAAPGSFSLTHSFAAGTFFPQVTANDSSGDRVNAAPGEPVYASAGLAAGLLASSLEAEVGVPVNFTGEIEDPPMAFQTNYSCSNSTTGVPDRTAALAVAFFSCTFSAPGEASIGFTASPFAPSLAPVHANLTLPVRPVLTVTGGAEQLSGEVGVPLLLPLDLEGGVPPFQVTESPSGAGPSRVGLVDQDGSLFVPVTPTTTGPFSASVRVEDALGRSVVDSEYAGEISAALNASVFASAAPAPGGADAVVTGSVTEGVPPVLWVVAPGIPPAAGATQEGNLSDLGGFAWSGRLPGEGNSTVAVGMMDGAGTLWERSFPLSLGPVLSVTASLATDQGSVPLRLMITISGGVAPFGVRWNGTLVTPGNASVDADGVYGWAVATNRSGPVGLGVAVVDRLGVTAAENLTANVSQGGTPPPGGGMPPRRFPPHLSRTLGAPSAPAASAETVPAAAGPTVPVVGALSAVAVALAGVTAFLFRRHRRPREERPPVPAAEGVLRRILEPADGADRATVELLGEESGIPLARLRDAIDRLIADGRVRSETGAEGEELLSWSEPEAA